MADRTPTAAAEPTDIEDEIPTGPGTLEVTILMLLGLVWLSAMLRLADTLVRANADSAAQMASAITLVLPTVIYASVLAGAGVGLGASLSRLAGGAAAGRPAIVRQAIVGASAGAVLGAVTAALILARYGGGSSMVAVALTVGVAALIGGTAAGLPRAILAAAVTGTLEVFLLGVVVNVFQDRLKSLLGASADPSSQIHAASTLAAATAIVQGVVVGLTAYLYLRRRVGSLRWPGFAVAGALPGVFLLIGQLLAVVGGSGLSDLSSQLSDADRMVQSITSGSDLNRALTVMFVGAVVAMIAIGRTLKRPAEDDDEL